VSSIEELRHASREEGRWFDFVFEHERRDRLIAFWMVDGPRILDRDYWSLLREVWSDAEHPFLNRQHYLRLFLSGRSERDAMMTPEEQKAFDKLSDPAILYRGVGDPEYARGLSWTNDENVAAWFARRFQPLGEGIVISAVVPKRRILAVSMNRDESEVVVDYRRLPFETCPMTASEIQHRADLVEHRKREKEQLELMQLLAKAK
jgi:hypothetical protein